MSAQTTLDEIWLDESGAEKNFYGGLIQLAVALYHLTNENPKGAKKIYEAAKSMLNSYGNIHQGLSLQKLILSMDALFDQHVKYDDMHADYKTILPKIEFKE
jgi:predicted metal-dependent hydrolase